MSLPKLSVKRPLTTLMLMLLIILLGTISLSKMSVDLFPDIEKPFMVITTKIEGAGPKEVELLVTKPLEESLSSLKNLQSLKSTSLEGKSVIVAELSFGVNMNYAALEAREKIDLVSWELPSGASSPKVQKFNPSAKAILQLSIPTDDVDKMKIFAEKNIKPKLERLDGVASVNILGGQSNEVKIALNREKMQGFDLSVDQVANIIDKQNKNWPGGTVRQGVQDLFVRTVGELNTIEEISALPLKLSKGGIIHLSDIASIELTKKKKTALVQTDGHGAVSVLIKKQSGANTVEIGKAILEEIEALKEKHPDLHLVMINNQSEDIGKLISNIKSTVILGGILAVLVLFAFLKNIKTTLIIGVSLPISVIATFLLLYFNKITINMMTLGGLALGGGMLVDNSIVVLENIFRFRQLGFSPKEASVKAAEEVALSVTASTLTTVAVFLPVIFLDGMIATLFRTLALTVTFSLLASLFVALTVIPMLASKLLKDSDFESNNTKGDKKGLVLQVLSKLDGFYNRFVGNYRKKLEWGLKNRGKVIAIGTLVFIISMSCVFLLDTGLFPSVDEGKAEVEVILPKGSKIDQTQLVMNDIEKKLSVINEIHTMHTTIGNTSSTNLNENKGENTASLLLIAHEEKKRDKSIDEIINHVRQILHDMPGIEFKVSRIAVTDGLAENEKPIEINVYGEEIDTLSLAGERVLESIESIAGMTDIGYSMSSGNPELQVIVDKNKAARFGLTTSDVGKQLQNSLSGISSTTLKQNGREVDIKVQGDKRFTQDLDTIGQIIVSGKKGLSVPIESIADLKLSKGPFAINHEKQKRVITIDANLSDVYYADIQAQINQALKTVDMPLGTYYEMGGQDENIKKNMNDMVGALVLAIVLVYMILASQFESLLNPFIIILSVPLAFGGGILGLVLFGQTLSIPAAIGTIVLSGVVVNDSILLIDYIDLCRSKGDSRAQAILKAGPIRLRPIIMTTLTTILGLVPMLLTSKAATLSPMAAVVIGGLILADVLILLMIPVLYTLFDDLQSKIKKSLNPEPL